MPDVLENNVKTQQPTTSKQQNIKTFAVLDLETSNLPEYNFNKVSIIELSVYGVASEELLTTKQLENIPKEPRVLHKLTLLFNPRMMVHPDSEAITGLNNYMLEYENWFDENAANTLLGFLAHLQQPVCLVAHNGRNFDFPIVKQAFNKLKKALPSETLCLDSLRAFHDIDDRRKSCSTATIPIESCSTETNENIGNALTDNEKIDWRAFNETTPKRQKSINAMGNKTKRRRSFETETDSPAKRDTTNESYLKSRRSLFPTETTKQKLTKYYPPKGVYRLSIMFSRIFNCMPKIAHHAEADVDMLLKLMQHYGSDFVEYAEQHAYPFAEVKEIGA